MVQDTIILLVKTIISFRKGEIKMADRNKVRLIDITLLVPSDIETGIIKCKNGKEIMFHDVSELSLQYQLDFLQVYLICFLSF